MILANLALRQITIAPTGLNAREETQTTTEFVEFTHAFDPPWIPWALLGITLVLFGIGIFLGRVVSRETRKLQEERAAEAAHAAAIPQETDEVVSEGVTIVLQLSKSGWILVGLLILAAAWILIFGESSPAWLKWALVGSAGAAVAIGAVLGRYLPLRS